MTKYFSFKFLSFWTQSNFLLCLNFNTIYDVRVTPKSKKLLVFSTNFNSATNKLKSRWSMVSRCLYLTYSNCFVSVIAIFDTTSFCGNFIKSSFTQWVFLLFSNFVMHHSLTCTITDQNPEGVFFLQHDNAIEVFTLFIFWVTYS